MIDLKQIEKAINNDHEAFASIIKIIQNELFSIAYLKLTNKSNVHDAIQETLINAYTNITKVKQTQYFKTWIIKILINECQKINQKDNRYINVDYEEYFINATSDNTYISNIFEILKEIDYKYQIAIYLYYAQEYQINEIAKILNENENTIKTRLKRGKEQLKNILEKKENQNG